MTYHNFNVDIATKYGIDIAIFLDNLFYCTRYYVASNENFREGRWWDSTRLSALLLQFPYWSPTTLRKVFRACIKKDLIVISNYDEMKEDQIFEYALKDAKLND